MQLQKESIVRIDEKIIIGQAVCEYHGYQFL